MSKKSKSKKHPQIECVGTVDAGTLDLAFQMAQRHAVVTYRVSVTCTYSDDKNRINLSASDNFLTFHHQFFTFFHF